MILAKSDSNCTSKRGGTQLGTHLSLCSFRIACQSCSFMEEQSLKCNDRIKQVYNIDYLSEFLRYRIGKSNRPWISNSGPSRKKIFSSSSCNRGWESEQIRSRFSTIKERITTATLLRKKTRYHECGTISRQIFKVFASLHERHTDHKVYWYSTTTRMLHTSVTCPESNSIQAVGRFSTSNSFNWQTATLYSGVCLFLCLSFKIWRTNELHDIWFFVSHVPC